MNAAAPSPSEALTLELPQVRVGAFLQGMFCLILVAAIYTMLGKAGWLDRIPGMMLFGIGLFAIVAVRRLQREARVKVELDGSAFRVHRRSGRVGEVAVSDLLLVRKDVGPDDELAYFLQFSEDRIVRLRAPTREQPEVLQHFVERLVERAGLGWTGTHAKRA